MLQPLYLDCGDCCDFGNSSGICNAICVELAMNKKLSQREIQSEISIPENLMIEESLFITYNRSRPLRIPDEGKRMWLRDICSILTVAGASHERVLKVIDNAGLEILRIVCKMNVQE